jgi:hypothetical protein
MRSGMRRWLGHARDVFIMEEMGKRRLAPIA